jgi:hypothetical protein
MKMSRIGMLSLIILALLSTTGCVGGIMARKNIVDGATAYNGRKYAEAEVLFRKALEWDKSQKVAQLFLARTLHSVYASDKTQTAKADEAIGEYKKIIPEYKKEVIEKKKALDAKPNDEKAKQEYAGSLSILSSSVSAVANLLDVTGKKDEWAVFQNEIGEDAEMPAEVRSNSLTSLASKQYSCANDISDAEPVKKTIEKGDKSEFTFTKPADAAEFEKFKGCVAKGTELINKAIDIQKQGNVETDSTWSYKASLLVQQMRLAEMEGRTADKDAVKKQSEEAKTKFNELANARREKEEEAERKKKEEEEKNK